MTDDKTADPTKQKWVDYIGAYQYHSLVLANFDPVRASLIFDQPAHVIAEAFVSRMCHDFRPPERNAR